jgi:3-hydroxyisobutyrate dehydrogenase-like beta-hydroxyacid dehydrogenase
MPETIGFIGLGRLGSPIAANLLEAGYELSVHNRTAAKADALVARGAKRADRAADAVTPGGIVVTLLWDDASVEKMVTSDDFLTRLGPDGIHVSMSTISPEGSRSLAALHARHGSVFVEAPIFGRPEAAEAKKLWIVCAGPQDAKDRVRPLFDAMGAQGIFDSGETIGAAAIVKLIGNFLIISAGSSLAEGLSLAGKTGLDPHAVIDMLTATLFPAPTYQTYGRAVAAGTATIGYSPIMAKDLGLFKSAAQAVASPTVMSSLLLDLRGSPA